MLLQFIINGLITGLLYSLLAIGFALVYNTTHIFHIAAAGIYVFAAYMFWWLAVSCGLPLLLAAAIAILLTVGLSWLSEVGLYRPLRRKKSSLNVIMIASIGMMTIIVNVIAMLFGNETKVVDNTIHKTFSHSDLIVTTPQLYQLIIAVIALTVFLVLLNKTRFGLKLYNRLFTSISHSKRSYEKVAADGDRIFRITVPPESVVCNIY